MCNRLRRGNRLSKWQIYPRRCNRAYKEENPPICQEPADLVQDLSRSSLARHRRRRTARKNPQPSEESGRRIPFALRKPDPSAAPQDDKYRESSIENRVIRFEAVAVHA